MLYKVAAPPAPDVGTPAVVLKFDPNPLHHGGLGVIRGLGRRGVPVYGVHEGAYIPAARSRYQAGRLVWRPAATDPDRVVAELLRLATSIGRPAVLLTTDDAGAIFLAEHGERLRPAYLFPNPPADLPRKLAAKDEMFELCQRHGIDTPATIRPESLAEAMSFATERGFPVVVKSTAPWVKEIGIKEIGVKQIGVKQAGSKVAGTRAAGSTEKAINQARVKRPAGADGKSRSIKGRALPSTSIVTSADELARWYHRFAEWKDRTGTDVRMLVQEFVPGDADCDWFFHGYRGRDGVCRPAFTGRKDRSYPVRAGLTSFGRSIRHDALATVATDALAKVGFHGVVDLDFRYDRTTGRFLLLDFNPRFGAQFRLFTDSAGVDLAWAAYLDLTGAPIPAGEQVDRRFVVENYDPITAFGQWRRGELEVAAWLRALRTAEERAWFAADDWAPFGLMCLRMGTNGARKAVQRARRK